MVKTKNVTPAKVIKIVLICIVVGFVLFVFALFQTCKTKSTDISKKAPFKAIIGKELVFKRPVRLFMEKYPTKKDFPYVLSDTNQNSWILYNSLLEADLPEIKLSDSIKANSKVIFEKALIYTNGVSGFSRPKLFGTLTNTEGRTYKVEYWWGERDSNIPMKGSYYAYKFEMAPWQDNIDTIRYHLPTAQWW